MAKTRDVSSHTPFQVAPEVEVTMIPSGGDGIDLDQPPVLTNDRNATGAAESVLQISRITI
jgi:hypothetical protein